MSKAPRPKKFGIDIRWLFVISFFAGLHYLVKLSGWTGHIVLGLGLLSVGLIGFVVISKYYPRKFDYFSIADIIDQNLSPESRNTYEGIAVLMVRRGHSYFFYGGLIVLFLVFFIHPSNLPRIAFGWFVSMLVIIFVSGMLRWDEISERHRREAKLKPIPTKGDRVELYDFETGKPLAHISKAELQYLIDSFQEWGMPDNDFFVMRETIDRFEERGADSHLVATLRQVMGKKNTMEIGWTLV